MKSRYRAFGETELQAKIRQELDQYRDSVYALVEKDCTYQAIAVAMTVLHREYGFGKQRLQRLKDLIEDEYAVMQSDVCGRSYSPRDCQQWLKDECGIDFEESRYEH